MTRHKLLASALTLALASVSGCAGTEMQEASQDKIRQATIQAIEGGFDLCFCEFGFVF